MPPSRAPPPLQIAMLNNLKPPLPPTAPPAEEDQNGEVWESTFEEGPLGIEFLEEADDGDQRTSEGVTVRHVNPNPDGSPSQAMIFKIEVGDDIVSVNGEDTTGWHIDKVVQHIKTSTRPLTIGFRRAYDYSGEHEVSLCPPPPPKKSNPWRAS